MSFGKSSFGTTTFGGTGETQSASKTVMLPSGEVVTFSDSKTVMLPSGIVITHTDSSQEVSGPVLSNPTASSITDNGCTPQVTTNNATGTAYMVVVPNGDVPSVAQIKAGQQSSGAAAIDSENIVVSASGVLNFAATTNGVAETDYELYFIHTDGSSNDSNIATIGFATSGAGTLDDVNTNEIIEDGEQNVTFATTDFVNEINHIRLESGGAVTYGKNINSTTGDGDFDLDAITSVGATATPGCPLTSASHAVTAYASDGIESDSLAVTYNPPSGYAVVEVQNVTNVRGTFSENFSGEVPDTSQVLYPTANTTSITSGGTTTAITAITQADPCVVTVNNSYSGGETITIKAIVGMTELNDINFKVSNPTGTTIELQDLDGNDIDSTGYTAYTSGGTVGDAGGVITTNQTSGNFDVYYWDLIGKSWIEVNVNADSVNFAEVTSEIIPATNNDYVTLSGTLADSGDRITAVPDLVAGDQLRYESILYDGATPTSYNVTININGTYTITGGPIPPGTYNFDVAAWDNSDDTWSSAVNQTVQINSGISGTATLVCQTASLAGVGEKIVKGTVDLVSTPPTMSSTGSKTIKVTADIDSESATMSSTGTKEVKGTGDLTAQAADLAATGGPILDGDGILNAQPASIDGTGKKIVKAQPSTLTSQTSDVASTGKKTVKAQPVNLQAQPADITSTGEVVVQGTAEFNAGSSQASGAGKKTIKSSSVLDSDISDLTATGKKTVKGTGDLVSSNAGFVAAGSGLVTGTSSLVSASPQLDVTIEKTVKGSSALIAQPSDLSGSSIKGVSGTASLQAQPAGVDSLAKKTIKGSSVTLISEVALLSGASVRIITGDAILQAQPAVLSSFQLDADLIFPKNRTAYPGRPFAYIMDPHDKVQFKVDFSRLLNSVETLDTIDVQINAEAAAYGITFDETYIPAVTQDRKAIIFTIKVDEAFRKDPIFDRNAFKVFLEVTVSTSLLQSFQRTNSIKLKQL